MSLISLVIALVLEQWRPLADRGKLFAPLVRYANYLESQFNAGEARQGAAAWFLAVLPAVLGAWLVYWIAQHAGPSFGPIAALVVNVAALYITMGFRQFSHAFTAIHLALKEDDLPRARQVLGEWLGQNCGDLTREEVARLAIEGALTASHRHVFGVVFWFVLLPGPSGAILYRLAMFLAARWGRTDPAASSFGSFGKFSRDVFAVLDWVPVRITAIAFAAVGDFEDAIYCWRSQAAKWSDSALGIVLAAGAGAIGVRLGMPIINVDGTVSDRPELGVGDEADAGFLDSTVGLVWRALVLYLLMLLLLGVAKAVS